MFGLFMYEQTIATYFSQVMAAVGGNTAGPGIEFLLTLCVMIF